MLNWIKKIFTKQYFLDATTVCAVNYELFIDSTGRLIFICSGYNGYVYGVNEWNNRLKHIFKVKTNKPVLDFVCVFNPFIHQKK